MCDKWVVLDAMGVIFETGDDTNDLLVPYIWHWRPAMSRESINEVYVEASLGQISSEQFWAEVGLGDTYPAVEQEYLDTCLKLDPAFREAATELTNDYCLALLSNDVREWSEYLRRKFGLDDLLDMIVVSGELGLRKPDERIYRLLLQRTASSAADCLIVDDRGKNLRPASALGMRTVRFARETSDDDFAADAEIAGFAQLPEVVEEVFLRQRGAH